MKKILVTGATGFIGRRLLPLLIKEYGAESIMALSSKKVHGIDAVDHNDYSFEEDILADLSEGFSLLHLGATTPKQISDYTSVRMFTENLRTTEYLLSHLPITPQQILYASTIDVYDREGSEVIDEDSAIQTKSAYGLSKYLSEMLVKEYCECNGVNCKIARIGNIYGPGEFVYGKLVGSLIRKSISGEDIILQGRGQIRRNLFYIDDLCSSIIDMLNSSIPDYTINLVSQYNYSVLDIAKEVVRAIDSKSKIVITDVLGRDDVFDAQKRTEILGECEETSLTEGIGYTVADYISENR